MNIFITKVFRENWWTNILVHQLTEAVAAMLVFFEKGVLKNVAKFTGKHLCQSLFFLIMMQA